MKLKLLKTTLGAVCLAGLLGAAGTANALVLDLNQGNPALSGFPPSYGTVTLTWVNSTTATITFTANSANNYLFGGQGALGLNVAGSFSVQGGAGGIAASGQPQASPVVPAFTINAGNEDGWGSFNLSIDNDDGFQQSFQTATFTLLATSGNSWANAGSILTGNENGHLIAAHIFAGNSGYTAALATGFATDGGAVPDAGSTMALVGVAVAGLGLLRRKLS